MNLEWGSEGAHKFVTNIGLITSSGPHGNNIMTAEWTRQVSYSPGMVMVNIRGFNATAENIEATKEFGVSIAAEDQNMLSSIAGGYKGKEVDKISALKELGFAFYPGKKINAPMVGGATLNLECRLLRQEKMGDHVMFLGEIVDMSVNAAGPLVYHGGKYYRLGEPLKRPGESEMASIKNVIAKHRKK